MTNTELRALLRAADRTAYWLAGKMGMSHTQIYRWCEGEQPIPDAKVPTIEALLVPVVQPEEATNAQADA